MRRALFAVFFFFSCGSEVPSPEVPQPASQGAPAPVASAPAPVVIAPPTPEEVAASYVASMEEVGQLYTQEGDCGATQEAVARYRSAHPGIPSQDPSLFGHIEQDPALRRRMTEAMEKITDGAMRCRVR